MPFPTKRSTNTTDFGTSAKYGGADINAAFDFIKLDVTNTPYSYIIYMAGSVYKAKNCNTGDIDFTQNTDAAALFRSVITAIGSSGGTIFVKNGTYNFLTNLPAPVGSGHLDRFLAVNLNDGINLIGESKLGTILKLGPNNSASVLGYDNGDTTARSMITIRNFTIDGNKANNTLDNLDHNQCGISGANCYYEYLSDLVVLNCCQQGIYTTTGQQTYFEFISAVANDKEGIHFDATHLGTGIELEAYGNRSAGIVVVGGNTNDPPHEYSAMTLIGGSAYGNNHSQQLYDAGDPTAGFFGGLYIVRAKDVSIYGFRAYGNGADTTQSYRDGIHIKQAEDILISGCSAYDNYRAGIYIDGTCSRITIDNCRCYNNKKKGGTDGEGSGITLKDVTYSEIKGNICYDINATKLQEYGIYEGSGCNNNNFHGNNVFNNLLGPFAVTGAESQFWNNFGHTSGFIINASSYVISSPEWDVNLVIHDAKNIVLGTGTGTKIGTATTQKLGFFNKTPIQQPGANADTSGATLPNLEIEVNQIKQTLRDLGLMA